jgi:hypothetical protein
VLLVLSSKPQSLSPGMCSSDRIDIVDAVPLFKGIRPSASKKNLQWCAENFATTKVLVVSSRKENHRQLDTENHREIIQDATVSLPTS